MRIVLGAVLLAVVAQTRPAPQPVAFWNVSVVDLDAGTNRGLVVRIEDGRIASIGPARGVPPANATVVDGSGKYLIPGLWDSHVHLTKLGAPSLLTFIANGVTSVRDMGSDLGEVLEWRRAIESGQRVGPRIKTSGQILESRTNVERMKREATVEPVDRIRLPVGNPEEARSAIARLAGAGADFIKIRTVADTATFKAVVAAARERGLRLTGHPLAPPETLIEAQMASVEHGLTFPPLDALGVDGRRKLFEQLKAADVHLGTTTVNLKNSVLVPFEEAVERLRTDPLRRYVTKYLASDWAEQVEEKKGPDAERGLQMYRSALPNLFRDFREMHGAGVKFLAGSDAAVVFIHPGPSLHGELESLVQDVGLTPVQALRTAIVNPAAFFGLQGELGAIRPGYRADLVLLERDPLDDIRNTRGIAGVMRDGAWLDRRALDALLERAARETSTYTDARTGADVSLQSQFDHLVVAIRSLPEGIAEFERLTGIKAAVGGKHPGRGTENALVSFGGGKYLEIIAPQPGATLSPRDEAMRGLDRLRIINWAVSVSDVDEASKVLQGAGFAVQPPQPGSRVTPSGERLEWSTFTLADSSLAVAPFFIRWSPSTKHPSTTAPAGCALLKLTLQDPKADRLSVALAALGVKDLSYVTGAPRIEATLTCGSKTVTLATP